MRDLLWAGGAVGFLAAYGAWLLFWDWVLRITRAEELVDFGWPKMVLALVLLGAPWAALVGFLLGRVLG